MEVPNPTPPLFAAEGQVCMHTLRHFCLKSTPPRSCLGTKAQTLIRRILTRDPQASSASLYPLHIKYLSTKRIKSLNNNKAGGTVAKLLSLLICHPEASRVQVAPPTRRGEGEDNRSGKQNPASLSSKMFLYGSFRPMRDEQIGLPEIPQQFPEAVCSLLRRCGWKSVPRSNN